MDLFRHAARRAADGGIFITVEIGERCPTRRMQCAEAAARNKHDPRLVGDAEAPARNVMEHRFPCVVDARQSVGGMTMRHVLLKSAIALALGLVPGQVFAQTEMMKKKPPEQSEGQQGGQNGTEKGQAPEGGQNMQNGGGNGEETPMKSERPEKNQPGMQQEEQNEQGGAQGKPGKKPMEEQGAGTKEKHGEKRQVNDEQRTELRRVFRENHVKAAPNVDFSVGVGARVPREIHLYRLPPRIVEIIPDYEGFMYFELADGRIAIVDPNTLEIVLIIA
ncbi:DUF1236 domain-containing protein [Pseudaminobacter soli (ex Li et al. 2025)]|uniref:DUF1236 domain-containing protein n=1 Tax=Pseudaminobacter soli (ex Li et al. 2025) TaxID=1295366 RepID=A0A2P7S821_9HYPH|nr:DUF1236 domain-containing protein [Mesorhizobium soli]PSJ58581.1 hypothetical protein C7I85_19525 [Mesorhizobium soli]